MSERVEERIRDCPQPGDQLTFSDRSWMFVGIVTSESIWVVTETGAEFTIERTRWRYITQLAAEVSENASNTSDA